MKIVITAPTGNIGSGVVRHLLDAPQNHELVLLVRNASRLPEEVRTHTSVTVREGSLHDKAFVADATRDADALFWVTPSDFAAPDVRRHETEIAYSVAHAMRTNHSISRVVNISSNSAHLREGVGLISLLAIVEGAINEASQETGASVLHLRPGFYMENFGMQLVPIAQYGRIFFPMRGDIPIPIVATQDIAAVAAARLLAPSARAGVSILGVHGPKDITLVEAARVLSDVLGREITFVEQNAEEGEVMMRQVGASEDFARLYAEMYQAFNRGIRPLEVRTAETTTPTTLAQWAETTLLPALQANETDNAPSS